QNHWCHYAFQDSLDKLISMIEMNFNSIETFGLVSTTRYLFELNIRLTLIEQDPRYGLAYYGQLLRDQVSYWKSLKEQLDREVEFLKALDLEEKVLHDAKLLELLKVEEPKLQEAMAAKLTTDTFNIIDSKAARKFSIHAEQARTNGYAFQSFLIQKNQLPEVTSSLAEVEREYDSYKSAVQQDILKIIKNWNWKQKAIETNHFFEYDYIYSFTSRMLHATPANITTNYKFLSRDEILIFLKYINVKLTDIVELSNKFITNPMKL
ncbi:hypothetical protein, partial [Enterobacter cloacae]|uniref:hypothetical protein n=2 Tax=Enterobacteriaceae TaxID=543 RepID=UPI00190A7A93